MFARYIVAGNAIAGVKDVIFWGFDRVGFCSGFHCFMWLINWFAMRVVRMRAPL